MATGRMSDLRKAVRQADRLIYDMTGTHLRTVVKKGISMGAEAISRHVFENVEETGPLYAILGVRPDAPDIIVKAAYKALSREYEPETGIHPDEGKFTQVVAAYRDIMLVRLQAEGGEGPPENGEGE